MFISRLHEVAPPPVDPIILHRRHRRKRKAKQWGSIVLVLGIAGAFLWWYFGTGATITSSANGDNEQEATQKNRNVVSTNVSLLADTDGDGLSDELEALYRTDRLLIDTDGDDFIDAMEIQNGYDPLNAGKSVRMVDLALVGTLAQGDPDTSIVSSGQSAGDHRRYYVLFDGTSMTYYSSDGTVQAQCPLNEEPKDACETLPNEVRTDFSRTYNGTSFTEEYHAPF